VTDIQTLQTELQSLAAKSGLTIADLTSLSSDSQAIAQTPFRINFQNLEKVTSELATAVAAGSSTDQAKTDFNALFNGSNVAQATITKSFNDMVKAIQDSGVTTTDLTTVAADQAAIQKDLANLPKGTWDGAGSKSGIGTDPSSVPSPTTTGNTTTGGTTTTTTSGKKHEHRKGNSRHGGHSGTHSARVHTVRTSIRTTHPLG
jgi:hypothetical protein